MSRRMTKPTKWHVCPARTRISLGIHPVWSVFAVRMKEASVLSYPLSIQRTLWSDWADAQADLSLCWVHKPFCWFCHEAAHILSSHKDQNTNEEWQHKKDIYISQTVDNHELCNLLYLQKRFHVPQFTNGLQRQLLVDMDFSPLRTWVAFGV